MGLLAAIIPIEEFTPAPYSDKLVLERAKDLLLLALRQYARAQMLIGREVIDRTGEPIGELADFQTDLASGEVRDVLLALEGEMRRVPLGALRAPSSGAAIVYNTGKKR
jgi:hypothetical protein